MINIIKEWISKIKIEDLDTYLNKKNIFLDNSELNIVYNYLKNDWYKFIYEPNNIIEDLKNKLSSENFSKLYNLYIWTKENYSHYL